MPYVAKEKQRDLRIDFFRGVAICVIFIDHVELNPFANYTFHRFGFSDAAEAFVFLSGLSCGIVYSAILARRGWQALMRSLVLRAAHLYAYYLALSLATIALAVSTVASKYHPDSFSRYAASVRVDAISAMWKAVLLIEQPALPSILLLYVALTLFAVPAFLVVARSSALLVLLLSGCLWALMQLPGHVPAEFSLFPYFNPLAWQFLFLIGMYFGARSHSGHVHLTQWPSLRLAMGIAASIVVLSLAFRVLPFVAHKAGFDVAGMPTFDTNDLYFKYNLSPLRLIHFLSVALIVAAYVRADSHLLRAGRDCIILIGRSSLQTFSAGVVLSMLGSIAFARVPLSVLEKCAFNIGGVLLLISVAFLLSPRRAISKQEAFQTTS